MVFEVGKRVVAELTPISEMADQARNVAQPPPDVSPQPFLWLPPSLPSRHGAAVLSRALSPSTAIRMSSGRGRIGGAALRLRDWIGLGLPRGPALFDSAEAPDR
jgi:hypothetical protein